MTTEEHARIIDYRPDTPKTCPDCGAAITKTREKQGNVYISGPADLAFAKDYGITTEGPVTTIWDEYVCDNGHHGPILIGSTMTPGPIPTHRTPPINHKALADNAKRAKTIRAGLKTRENRYLTDLWHQLTKGTPAP